MTDKQLSMKTRGWDQSNHNYFFRDLKNKEASACAVWYVYGEVFRERL